MRRCYPLTNCDWLRIGAAVVLAVAAALLLAGCGQPIAAVEPGAVAPHLGEANAAALVDVKVKAALADLSLAFSNQIGQMQLQWEAKLSAQATLITTLRTELSAQATVNTDLKAELTSVKKQIVSGTGNVVNSPWPVVAAVAVLAGFAVIALVVIVYLVAHAHGRTQERKKALQLIASGT